MNFQAAKFYFEDMFKNVWTTTPIHFAGQEFSGEGISKWVNPVYSPRSMTHSGLSLTANYNYGSLYVACWADTDVDAMALGDEIVDFIKNTTDPFFKVKNINVDDHGWQSSNKVYMILSFTIEYYVGNCGESNKKCADSVGGFDGKSYYLYKPWVYDCTMFKV